jgi:hypothetical protein
VVEMNDPEVRDADFPAGGLMTTARGWLRQTDWMADAAIGISFGYLTNGYDRNDLREGRCGVAVCSLAGACAE